MNDPYAFPTFVFAGLGVLIGLASLFVLLVFRHRDRVDLDIVAFEDEGDEIHFKIRNRGGPPAPVPDSRSRPSAASLPPPTEAATAAI